MTSNLLRRFGTFAAVAILLLLFAAACVTEPGAVLVSMRQAGTTADGLNYGPEDIIAVANNGSPEWFTFFDGSEHGLTPKHSLNAFSFNEYMVSFMSNGGPGTQDDVLDIPDLYMTFRPNSIAVPGISGRVMGQDIVKYSETDSNDPGTFELLFDGSDVGLTTRTEKIDGLGYWAPETYPDPIYEDQCPAGIFFITTQGPYRVRGATGGQIVGSGFDVLLFCATNVGPNTAGFWYRVFNNRDYGYFYPGRASTSLDVVAFELDPNVTSAMAGKGPSANAPEPDLDAGIAFLFTPRTAFGITGETPKIFEPSQLYLFAGTEGQPLGFDGPLVDFNTGEDFTTSTTFPPVNGVVQSVSIVDFPFGTPTPP